MDNTITSKTKLLYIGNDPSLVDLFQYSDLFEMVIKENGLAAIYWLTENKFRLFDMNDDTRFEVVYEEKQDIDAIICEYNLPGINGLSFFRKLKLNKFYQKIPFIILLPFIDYAIKQEAYFMGVDDLYHKDISPEVIHSRIQFLRKFKLEYEPKPLSLHDEEMTPYKTPWPKRLFDILLASFALVILSPLMLLTVIAIRLESRGKVYYISKRVGSNYRIFNFYKFRSMYPDAEKRVKDVAHLNQYISESVEENCSECAKLPAGHSCSPKVYYDGEEICERLANKRRVHRNNPYL